MTQIGAVVFLSVFCLFVVVWVVWSLKKKLEHEDYPVFEGFCMAYFTVFIPLAIVYGIYVLGSIVAVALGVSM